MKKIVQQIGIKRALILLAAGLCLIFLSIPSAGTKEEETKTSIEETDEQNDVRELEERLVEILSTVEGVGKVEVMITLKSSKESILNKDTPYEEGENASVQKNITEAVTALFDVSVNKIKVLKMEDGS